MKNAKIIEHEFIMAKEAHNSALFTTSNGYMGIRGSFEENATSSVQGAFIRGLIDEIPFNQEVSIDNEYMRKYYVNEDGAKEAETQEGVINFADILLVKIEIGGEIFYPWEGKIHEWERTLDIENSCLTRRVVWENRKGNVTELLFERFASFANDHIYAIKISVTPKNHSEKIRVISGADLRTKSSGFKMCALSDCRFSDNTICFELKTKGKYAHEFHIGIVNSFISEKNFNDEKFLTQEKTFAEAVVFEKKIYISTSRDEDALSTNEGAELLKNSSYDELFAIHKKAWREFFKKIDIKIDGDDEADSALRFCNYHTAISIPKNDCVHSLAAKNLTGQGYNDYVWWDCEVYQCPVFIYAGIENVKNMLMYRYNRLDAARQISKKEGRRGARYPFISSVTGEEKVWKHVRHPLLQYHVVADVAWGLLNYYYATYDRDFMKNYGMTMLQEISDYWVSRVEEKNGRYEINSVTGCDEHHPYVDNDAYTNYLVHYVLKSTIKLSRQFSVHINPAWEDVLQKLYLPMEKSGLIPQFDGYFNLSQSLETEGGANDFQMKNAGGMYHKSQIIKQPDVMVLFSYIHNDFEKYVYERNWDYYEAMCEASSSLTFPVHSICAFDNNQIYKGYKYFMQCAQIDLKDIHNCAKDGVHAGCSAGAYYSIVRGLAGIEMCEEFIKVNPKMLPWWKSVRFNLKWHNTAFGVELTEGKAVLTPEAKITVKFNGEIMEISEKTVFEIR